MRTTKDSRQLYLESLFPLKNNLLLQSREITDQEGSSWISLSYTEVKVLQQLIKMAGAKKIVEIGTLTGFSALGMLEALNGDARMWTFEKDPARAQHADRLLKSHCERTGQKAEVVVGDAEEMLKTIESQGPFDAIFIDGNKGSYGVYLAWAEKNLRKGAIIIADNIYLSGSVYDPNTKTDYGPKQIKVMQDFNLKLADPVNYDSFVIPTEEGLFVALKKF